MQKSLWVWLMDANRGYIFLSSNYQYPECWEGDFMAGSPETDMGALRKEKEKMTVHPFIKVF